MANFNRDRQSKGRDSNRGFRSGGPRGPVELYRATCDRCRKECQVPFRPTSGKPVYCSDCFQSNGGSDSRRFDNNSNFSSNRNTRPNYDDRQDLRSEVRQLFEAVCDECGNECKVPFQPSGDKPIYCSNCFGEKKGAINDSAQPRNNEQLEALNAKLDRILQILEPTAVPEVLEVEEPLVLDAEPIAPVKEKKVAKKKATKKS